MTRRLHRALVPLAAAALVVPATASTASAAKAPGVPGVAAVAKIYPHLAGGSATKGTASIVRLPGKKCDGQGKKVKGAKQTFVSYSAADATSAGTGKEPTLIVSATRFPSAKAATGYLKASATAAKKCPTAGLPDLGDIQVKVSKIKVNLGQQSWGYRVKVVSESFTVVTNSILVRKGKNIVSTGASSLDGTAPSKTKSVKLTKLALKTAS